MSEHEGTGTHTTVEGARGLLDVSALRSDYRTLVRDHYADAHTARLMLVEGVLAGLPDESADPEGFATCAVKAARTYQEVRAW